MKKRTKRLPLPLADYHAMLADVQAMLAEPDLTPYERRVLQKEAGILQSRIDKPETRPGAGNTP